jgi:hypothetical protein
VWMIGQVAAILFGSSHQYLPVRLVDMLGCSCACPAPGTTRLGPGRGTAGRCCRGQWACTRLRC